MGDGIRTLDARTTLSFHSSVSPDISSDEGDVSLYQPSHGDLERVGLSTPSVSDIDADLTKMATDVSGIVNYVEGPNEE